MDSADFITKNMTEEMLDDPDATNTKPIENLFGNLDHELRKTGPQGFMKVSDNLIIKYCSDLIGIGYQWRTKANRQKAKELREKEQSFTKVQQALIDININEEDAVKLAQNNKIFRLYIILQGEHTMVQ